MKPPASSFYLVPTSLPYFKVAGIVASGVLSGTLFGITYPSIPALLNNPSSTSLAKQWQTLFDRGKVLGITLAGSGGIAFFTAATLQYRHFLPYLGTLTSGLLTIGIVPFTLVFINPVNKKLIAINQSVITLGEDESKVKINEVRQLVDRWGLLNAIRGLLPLTGFVLAVVSAVII